jgi:pimeloyl-ACP methyl ester carboxylesterase
MPPGIRSRTVANVNGLTVHMLEAGYETSGRPAVLLLHGFPELAYSWRKVMVPLASAGYHVIAPDQRGYGRTRGWDDSYDADPDPFRILNMVRMPWRSCTRSATAPSPWWPDTMQERPSHPGPRSSGPISSVPSRS